MSVTPDSLFNLNYLNKNEKPNGLPTVSRRLIDWLPKPSNLLQSWARIQHRRFLLRVTTLQAMQWAKFSGSAADFSVFRRRIRDNLEDGLSSDAQKIESVSTEVCHRWSIWCCSKTCRVLIWRYRCRFRRSLRPTSYGRGYLHWRVDSGTKTGK